MFATKRFLVLSYSGLQPRRRNYIVTFQGKIVAGFEATTDDERGCIHVYENAFKSIDHQTVYVSELSEESIFYEVFHEWAKKTKYQIYFYEKYLSKKTRKVLAKNMNAMKSVMYCDALMLEV